MVWCIDSERSKGAPGDFGEHFLAWVRESSGIAWGPGLTDTEIHAAQVRWGLEFPPDMRLFLRVMHREAEGEARFFDWRKDDVDARIRAAIDGVLFDVEENGHPGHDAWGERPSTRDGMMARLVEVSRAAKLIPLRGHRFLVGEPCAPGNPVLSIHQTDVIVYGDDLRGYMLHELFGDATSCAGGEPLLDRWRQIPFWGAFVS